MELGRRIVPAHVLYEDETGIVRHNPQKLARVLLRWYGRANQGRYVSAMGNGQWAIGNSVIKQYSSDKTKTLVETAIYRVSKTS